MKEEPKLASCGACTIKTKDENDVNHFALGKPKLTISQSPFWCHYHDYIIIAYFGLL